MYRKEKKNNPNWRLLKFVQQSRGARALFIVPTNHKDTQHTNTRQNSNFEKKNKFLASHWPHTTRSSMNLFSSQYNMISSEK